MSSKTKVLLNIADVKNLIDLSWNQIGILLTGLTPKESSKVISVLFKELEALHSKLSDNHKNDNSSQIGENETLEVELNEHVRQDCVTDYHVETVIPDYEGNSLEVIEIIEQNELAMEDDTFAEIQGHGKLTNNKSKTIDNQWYTFVSNENESVKESEKHVQDEQTDNHEIEVDKVVNCAGSWANNIASFSA